MMMLNYELMNLRCSVEHDHLSMLLLLLHQLMTVMFDEFYEFPVIYYLLVALAFFVGIDPLKKAFSLIEGEKEKEKTIDFT